MTDKICPQDRILFFPYNDPNGEDDRLPTPLRTQWIQPVLLLRRAHPPVLRLPFWVLQFEYRDVLHDIADFIYINGSWNQAFGLVEVEDDDMVMKEGSIEVQGLRVEYEEYTREGFFSFGKTTKHMPLQEIDLKVKNGDRVAVIGRNGSGKSTLLLSLAGFLRPERGSIHTKGRTLFLAGVDPRFSPELTGRENITDLAPAYGIPGHLIEKFTESVKDFAELGDNFERKYGNYSSY